MRYRRKISIWEAKYGGYVYNLDVTEIKSLIRSNEAIRGVWS